MKRKLASRILTTHTGSLPRTQKVVDLLMAERKEPGKHKAALDAAVREAMRRWCKTPGRMRHRRHQ